ncbi:MAG: DNA translocase FtsK [Clostridia bacterium]|nr:DNA translocase FtsK [Clostridia bacterium]
MAKKKSKSKSKKVKKEVPELGIIITIIVSILLTVLIYTESGYIGMTLSDFFGGMFGIIKYILPIGAFAVTVKMACEDEDNYLSSKIFQYTLLLIFVAVILSVYQIYNGRIDIEQDLSSIVKEAYQLGENNVGGGALGTIAAVPLFKLFGKIGTIILSIGVSLILATVAFGIDISEMVRSWLQTGVNKSKEKHQERRAIREQQIINRNREQEIENAKREKTLMENRKAYLEIDDDEQVTEDTPIKINLNGREVEEDKKGRKKFKHNKNDIVPLGGQEEIKEMEPDFIESNLFKQEEEKKEDKVKEVLQLEHALVVEDEHYEYPPIELLGKGEKKAIKGGAKALAEVATRLQKTLYSFGVQAKVENVSVGPAITRYELKPAEGVRVSKIANLADDIALNLAAETIRIEAPIPGKQAVGIEVPNQEKEMVNLREVLESDEFQDSNSKLSVGLGKDVSGKIALADIAKMPHALIAGSTGSGKSVCINTIITSIIYKAKPSEVKLVMVDPKVVELSVYNGIPHLLIPVVTDPKKAAGALAWAVQEMDNRYNVFAQKGVRDLKGYNALIEREEGVGKLPQIVIIIDELADLMMVAAKDVEDSICRLAQKARAAGMHLIIATQRPSVDVITGIIKANVPSRIAFAVSSQVDSRTILDQVGAEKLLGKGDMLFFPSGSPKPTRIQGAFVSDEEVEKIVSFVKSNGEAKYSEEILESIENSKSDKEISDKMKKDDDTDEYLEDAIEMVIETGQASTSFIQKKFKVGYSRAGRIIDQMEERGIISGHQGSKPRQVLMSKERWEELKMGTPPQQEEVE